MTLMSCLHAAVSLDDDAEDCAVSSLNESLLKTVKLHHLIAHAADDIKLHGHEKHYSAQVGGYTLHKASVELVLNRRAQ